MFRFALLVSFVISASCSTPLPAPRSYYPTTTPQGVTCVTIDGRPMVGSQNAWAQAVRRRFPDQDAVILAGHGGYHAETGVWMSGFFPVRRHVSWAREQWPDALIILLVCNERGHRLDVPGVVYALEAVWVLPDRNLDSRSRDEPEVVGSIFEFEVVPWAH